MLHCSLRVHHTLSEGNIQYNARRCLSNAASSTPCTPQRYKSLTRECFDLGCSVKIFKMFTVCYKKQMSADPNMHIFFLEEWGVKK